MFSTTTNKAKLIILFILMGLCGIYYYAQIATFFMVPIRISHRLFTPTEKLYKPILFEDFDFYKKGYSKTFPINYKYFDKYRINIYDENKKIPGDFYGLDKEYKLNGKLKLEYFSGNELLETKFIFQHIGGASGFSKEGYPDNKYYIYIVIDYFYIPLKNKHQDLKLKVTVIKPIEKIENSNLKLKISVMNM